MWGGKAVNASVGAHYHPINYSYKQQTEEK